LGFVANVRQEVEQRVLYELARAVTSPEFMYRLHGPGALRGRGKGAVRRGEKLTFFVI